ncbi:MULTISPECIES: hypothetical protein [unclassified Luteococcus]|uniref:hypothetical protein n=1 Tax=unclassified Luteococcus TaxID=2639923 RepID=UPI00313DF3B2
MSDRCEYSDLPTETCAHCTGATEPRYGDQALAGLAGSPDLRKGRPVGRELDSGRLFAPADVTMPGWGQPCAKCGAMAGDAFICPRCVEQLEVDCANAPMLLDQLEVTVTRLDRVYRPAPPPDAEASEPMPYSVAASAARDELRWALVTGAQAVLVRLGKQWVGDDSPAAVADWLGRNSASVALHPEGDQIAHQVQAAMRKALRAIDTMPERVLAGPCPTCGSRLMAFRGSPTVWCDTCAKRHQVADVRAGMMARFEGELYTISGLVTIARTMGYTVRKKVVEDMARRGRIAPSGVSSDGWRTYQATDLLTVLEERETS